MDNRFQQFRELLKNFSDREESLKERLINRDQLLNSIGIYQQLLESATISQQPGPNTNQAGTLGLIQQISNNSYQTNL